MNTGTTVKITSDCEGFTEDGKPVNVRIGRIGVLLDFAIGHGIRDGIIVAFNAPTENEANLLLIPAWAVDVVDNLD